MPIGFNPFNPMSYVNAAATDATNKALGKPRVSKGTPIPIQARSEDPGIKLSKKQVAGRVELTFSGKSKGPVMQKPNEYYGAQPRARVVSLGVAVAEAPTVDASGQTNFTEKNHRSFSRGTKPGDTGLIVAQQFAREINERLSAFKAEVKAGATPDAAKLIITRR